MNRGSAVFLRLLLVLLLGACSSGEAQQKNVSRTPANQQISPQPEQAIVCREVVRHLQRSHYRRLPFNDRLSSKVFDRYLSDIDPEKMYFFSSDIAEFEKYRYALDDSIQNGGLEPAYIIFNRYRKRIADRLDFVLKLLGSGPEKLAFPPDERLDTDREDDTWPATLRDMNRLWSKRLKNSVISLKLADKQNDEIRTVLTKRFSSRKNRALQLNSDDVFELYMNALVRIFGPHTQYFSPQETQNFNIHMSLTLEGIGAVLQSENEYTKIVRLIPAGPADKSNKLKPADRIVGVGQEDGDIVDVVGWRLDDVVELIRGPKGTMVHLEVIPVDAPDEHRRKIVSIKRNTVKLEEQSAQKKILSVSRAGREHKIGVITIPTFYLDFQALKTGRDDFKSTTRDVQHLLVELDKQGIDGLIVDLRNNGGGALQEVGLLTGLFIDKGPIVQVKDEKANVEVLQDPNPGVAYRGPMAVMVNRLSASASEIFAAAIQDYNRGIIVGGKTYGKGTVQTLIPLSRGQLKLTSAKFYRITGGSTQNRGITPDILFPSPYNPDDIGESALPEALPWDTIAEVSHAPLPDISGIRARLLQKHYERIKHNPDYEYLVGLIEHLEKTRAETTVSLNEFLRKQELRQAEQERLALENSRRTAKGLTPVTALDDLYADNQTEADEDDALLQETAELVVDFAEAL